MIAPEIITFFTAMTPFLELKLAIPLGREMGLSAVSTLFFAVSGTMIPAALGLAYAEKILTYLEKHSKLVHAFCHNFLEKTRKKHGKNFNRFGTIILISLVAIPLPGSGASTGTAVAFLFGVDYWKAITLVTIGSVIAGLLVSAGVQSLDSFLHFLN